MKTNTVISFAIIFAIVVLIVLFFPCLFIRDMSGDIFTKPLINPVDLKISYIHSVQKTPVEEYLKVERLGTIRLYETHYRSFGVGLPFLESEGEFYQEGDRYVLKMNREFKSLALRVGVETDLTIEAAGNTFHIYKMLPVGARVEIFAKPYIIGRFFR